MHIPKWAEALSHLCRVLKPSGKLVVMESNHNSLEARIVLLIRQITSRRSKLIETPGGSNSGRRQTANRLSFELRTSNAYSTN